VGYNAAKKSGIEGVPFKELILKGAERGQNIRVTMVYVHKSGYLYGSVESKLTLDSTRSVYYV